MLKHVLALSTVLALSFGSSYADTRDEVAAGDEFHLAACCENCEKGEDCAQQSETILADCGCKKKKPKPAEEKVAGSCSDCGKKRNESSDEFACCGSEENDEKLAGSCGDCGKKRNESSDELCCGGEENSEENHLA